MERVTVYRSWTVLIEMGDIQALAPGRNMEPLLEDIGSVLVKTFNRSMVGYTWDPDNERLLVTLKTQEQAVILRDTWEDLVQTLFPAE